MSVSSHVLDFLTLACWTRTGTGSRRVFNGTMRRQRLLQGYTQVWQIPGIHRSICWGGQQITYTFDPPKLGDRSPTGELIAPLYHSLLLQSSPWLRSCGLQVAGWRRVVLLYSLAVVRPSQAFHPWWCDTLVREYRVMLSSFRQWRTEHVQKQVTGTVSMTPGAVSEWLLHGYTQVWQIPGIYRFMCWGGQGGTYTFWSARAWRPSTYGRAHSSFEPLTTAAVVAVTTQLWPTSRRSPPSSITLLNTISTALLETGGRGRHSIVPCVPFNNN